MFLVSIKFNSTKQTEPNVNSQQTSPIDIDIYSRRLKATEVFGLGSGVSAKTMSSNTTRVYRDRGLT